MGSTPISSTIMIKNIRFNFLIFYYIELLYEKMFMIDTQKEEDDNPGDLNK